MYAPTVSKRGCLIGWLNSFASRRLRRPRTPTRANTAKAMAELCRDYYVDRIVSRAAFLSARALLDAAPTSSRDAPAVDSRPHGYWPPPIPASSSLP
jgi:hypothetical protein